MPKRYAWLVNTIAVASTCTIATFLAHRLVFGRWSDSVLAQLSQFLIFGLLYGFFSTWLGPRVKARVEAARTLTTLSLTNPDPGQPQEGEGVETTER